MWGEDRGWMGRCLSRGCETLPKLGMRAGEYKTASVSGRRNLNSFLSVRR